MPNARTHLWLTGSLVWLVGAQLYGAAPVRGDRAAGVANDVAVAQAVRAIEAETAHKAQLSDALLALDQRERALTSSLRGHIKALYRISRSGNSPVAGGFDAMRLHLARVRRLKSMVQRELSTVAQLRAEQNEARAAATRSDDALANAQQQLTQLQAQRASESRGATRPEPGVDHGFYGIRLSSGQTVADFESKRGKLAVPVAGELRIRDLRRGRATAVLFEAPTGTTVRAVADGRVVHTTADTVVVDHGDGYQTAYGRLGNVDVRVGDELSTHARLGSIADSVDDQDDPALLFEVRKGARSVPARPWLGL